MKMGKQRGGASAAVLEAPEPKYASASEPAWRGQGPAPAGALLRGYAASEPSGYDAETDDDEYRPRRGAFRPSVRGLLGSTGGRVIAGVAVVVLMGGLLVGMAAARYYVLHDPRFVVAESEDIQISGNTHLTREQLLTVFGGDLERSIFRISLADREADLERLPWVEHATVMRLLPNRLRVLVVERTPVAFARQGTQIGLVDASGVLLDMGSNPAAARFSFPVLTGISANDTAAARAVRMGLYLRFMKELDGGAKPLSKTVSEVDVTDPDDLKALIAGGTGSGQGEMLVHFGDGQFLSRYEQFEKLLPEWRQQYPKLASADMRYEGQIVLEMRKDRGEGIEEGVGGVAVASAAGASQVSAAKPAVPIPAVAVKTAEKKPVVKKVLAKKVVAKKVLAKAGKGKAAVGRPARASGSSAANDKVFAALAAQRKAAAK